MLMKGHNFSFRLPVELAGIVLRCPLSLTLIQEEMTVRRDNVTTGFLDEEAKNAGSIVNVNRAVGVVEDWFCTGDRGELDEEGDIRLTGSARE